ncbi:phosphonate C-P lyase system protein PhnG [Aquabacterium sp. A7-Y]|uniref:phosphonate C-P lyase system protein PhnG n=1 Tax=Aquabacterium sp. A7-Y TaxID=1349605 RepID=UPI00223D9EA1|nr:phosphonate C-P lyase system protein PhnG [Aquabacterium sp. A7-Y]MCW7541331.1 phosphonate C-P lyase system protein PhnG [Aquabacterium sp. A7-Y]
MTHTDPPDNGRRAWLSLLAQAPREQLAAQAPPVLADHGFEWLRRPETGLVMVRARITNGGDRFNVGEATVTRCVVTHRPAQGPATAGVGWVLGRDAQRAEWIAKLDALLQLPSLHALLADAVLAPLAAALAERRAADAARTAASRVLFYTLQPEAAR